MPIDIDKLNLLETIQNKDKSPIMKIISKNLFIYLYVLNNDKIEINDLQELVLKINGNKCQPKELHSTYSLGKKLAKYKKIFNKTSCLLGGRHLTYYSKN